MLFKLIRGTNIITNELFYHTLSESVAGKQIELDKKTKTSTPLNCITPVEKHQALIIVSNYLFSIRKMQYSPRFVIIKNLETNFLSRNFLHTTFNFDAAGGKWSFKYKRFSMSDPSPLIISETFSWRSLKYSFIIASRTLTVLNFISNILCFCM